jgi:AbrB family transcriptional regulator, transcriptional pleiotropic regulator of transition state genes
MTNLDKEIYYNMSLRGAIKMKSTGIVRKVDELGRVVIPIELRRTLGIAEKDALEIYVDDERIILKKYKPNMTCQVTGEVSDNNLTLANGKLILSREGAEQLVSEIQSQFELVK